jgi:bifunctional DNase/RNase
MVEMELVAVRIELPGNAPVVLLREVAGSNRLLPIFIGQPEATAIAFSVDGVVTPRPMTHDLLRDVVEALGASIERVVVTDLRDGTFYAEIRMQLGEAEHVVSSRPSDAIALALRVGCPLYAEEEVLATAGLVEPPEEEESEEVVEQFRAFIDTVDPEDFAS